MSKMLLFLGYDRNKTRLIDAIEKTGWIVSQTSSEDIDLAQYDLAVAFGYRHKISKDKLRMARRAVVNLHISYLPYNRGAHPNFWSFYDNTPSGVSIHEVNEKIDGGPICYQKYVNFSKDENTFDKTYNRLILEVENLFCENLDRILSGDYVAREQRGVGTFHRRNDLPSEMIDWGADIRQTILNIDQKYKNCLRREQDIIDEIQAIRSQNNVNWMDLLRIALAHAPLETKRILRQINQDDSTISQLLKDLGK